MSSDTGRTTHIYFVLDRSGSMGSIRDDVIGGFNAFVDDQRRDGLPVRMTLVLFDSQEPFARLLDAVPIAEVPPLNARRFQPRAMTPLYDAMGRGLAEARARELAREAEGLEKEEILFVAFTDGMENASREYTRQQIWKAVEENEARGWSFVYLGANQDAYAEGEAMGVDPRSTQNFLADGQGVGSAFSSLSRGTSRLKQKMRLSQWSDRGDFFEDDKEAEDDAKKRKH